MENLTQQQFLRQISIGISLFHVLTESERRCERLLSQAAARIKEMGCPFIWTCTDGLSRDGEIVPDTADPLRALDFVISQPGPLLLILKDIHKFWRNNPILVRKIKDLSCSSKNKGKVAVIIGEEEEWTPYCLREEIVLLKQGLPDLEEIRTYLAQIRDNDPSLASACETEPELLERLVVAGRGLDLIDLERAIRTLRLTNMTGSDAVRSLLENKRRILQQSGIMELVLDNAGCDQLGGMENLKHWLKRREKAFGLEGISSGAGLPKGVLVMGVAGCGKSLFVKAIAAEWHLPLIRLDMSTVYSGIFGSPEASLNKAFKTAEAVAPCVLWIDEIESGITTHGFKSEGGASSRVLGSFLTWMQEKREPVFVAATANAIEMLPAEVLRKGRFDEIFYVGLPETAAREEIFRIHLANRDCDLSIFDTKLLAGSTKGFSGAEIEQVVNSASFEARADQRRMTQQDLMAMVSRTVPLSITMAEQIKKIEAWAFKRAVPASGSL